MGVCDAHEGMATNIEHLRSGQDDLFKVSAKTALDVNSMSSHVAQLFELTSQSDDRFKEFKIEMTESLGEILTEIRRIKRRPSFSKIVAIVIPSLLGSGGLVTLISILLAKSGK